MVECGRGAPDVTRDLLTIAESSLVPDLWLNADKSDEEEEVVETDGAVGYRERLTLFPGSEL
jgi:hypothetical protein